MAGLTGLDALALEDRHRSALEQALAWLPEVITPVGILVSGSILRGNPHPASDLDIVVLHDAPWRRRVQRWFNGTPVEVFFNSEAWLRHSLKKETAQGRPVMAHMLATGATLLDTEDRLSALRKEALTVLERGPGFSPDALLRDRYAAATQVEDALDFRDEDTADARQVRALAVAALVRHAFLKRNQFLPRPKERLQVLAQSQPELASRLSAALQLPHSEALTALREASESLIGGAGFFEWDSGPETTLGGGEAGSAQSGIMTIVRITPLLNVADVERSRQFYAETMGFQVSDLAGPQDDPVWARLTRGEAALMLNRRGEGRDRRLFERADHRDVVLYIWVEDAADLHGRLVRLGVDVGDLEQQDYGLLQFALYDPDGYELAITGPPSPA